MSVVTSPSRIQTASEGMNGAVKLAFTNSGGKTHLTDLYQTAPLRVLFPNSAPNDILSAALVTTSGGLVGGDHLNIDVKLADKASVQIIGQAAEKIYRSNGPDTLFKATLSVGKQAWLEWLPQETIVFDQARLRRKTNVDVAPGGTFLGAEILVFGRTAMDESFDTGLVRDVWDIRRNGQLIWQDALYLSGDIKAILNHPAGFNGARCAATSILVSDNAAEYLDFVRTLLKDAPENVNCAATLTNNILVTRWMARNSQDLRKLFGDYWAALRHELKGLPRTMPRLWHM